MGNVRRLQGKYRVAGRCRARLPAWRTHTSLGCEVLEDRRVLTLLILPTFDSSINNDPNAVTIKATINTAIHAVESCFSDSITVKIKFKESASGLGGSSTFITTVSYSDYLAALMSHATTADDTAALATLPAGPNNPVNGGTNVTIRTADARALGFSAFETTDSTISLNTSICNLTRVPVDPNTIDPSKYDLLAVTSHEIDEALGYGSALNNLNNGDPAPATIQADDLFRYDQNGARTYNTTLSTQAYFSIDGGTTDLARFNQKQGADFSDWFSTGPHTPQVQDAFDTPGATPDLGVELRRLDVLGYTRIANAAPVVTAPSLQASTEGTATAFNLGSFSDPDTGPWGVTVSWGDGSPNTTFFVASAGALGTKLHTYAEQGSYVPTVTVTDYTSLTDSKTFNVNVSDPAVVPTGGLSVNGVEGASTGPVLVATFTDPGGPEPVGDYSADIDWGDGTGLQVGAGAITLNGSTFEVRGSHTYAEASSPARPGSNPYQISITVHHETSTTPSPATSTATIADATLNATGVNVSATEGLAFSGPVATFTDVNPSAPLSDYTATITWGDSHVSAGAIALISGVLTVSGSNTYAEEGSDPISVTINDADGSTANATSTASVADAPLNATGVNVAAAQGVPFSGPVATFTDANPSAPLSDYTATITWGDSHVSAGTIALVSGVLTVSGTNTYAAAGSYSISVTINDVGGSSAMASSTANVVAQGSQVVGRNLFYAASTRYDATGNPQTPLPFSDDNAIATDKTAYLPGSGAATFANVSSYDRGINGIMVDLSGSGSHTSITQANILDDFTFKVGNNNAPSTWAAAPNPTTVTVRAGAGVSGSDRVELIWADGAIKEQWLEVITKATTNTGLAANDVFFFGDAAANSGNGDTATLSETTSVDELGARNNAKTLLNNIPITNLFDYNRDGLVNSVDQLLARNNSQTLGATRYLNIPIGGPFAPFPPSGDGGGDSVANSAAAPTASSSQEAVASDLASPSAPSGNAATLSALTMQSAGAATSTASDFSAVGPLGVVDEQLLELIAVRRHLQGLQRP
jgi:hypothetical protein